MKTLTIKIPTSITEIKDLWKERSSKRYRHNKAVFADFAVAVNEEVRSNYWSKDISEYARKAIADPYSGRICELYNEYKNKLK